jgi:hypothetical protein
MPVKDALEMAKKNKAEIVDLKFVDFPGYGSIFRYRPPSSMASYSTRDWDLTGRASEDFNRSTNRT